MTTGLPDWYKANVIFPNICSYVWSFSGSGETDASKSNAYITIGKNIETNLKRKRVHVHSFSASGYITWIRNTVYMQTYHDRIFYRLIFMDVNNNAIAGVTELQTPIVVERVDKLTVKIVLPANRFADSSNPSYYSYNIVFHVSYKII